MTWVKLDWFPNFTKKNTLLWTQVWRWKQCCSVVQLYCHWCIIPKGIMCFCKCSCTLNKAALLLSGHLKKSVLIFELKCKNLRFTKSVFPLVFVLKVTDGCLFWHTSTVWRDYKSAVVLWWCGLILLIDVAPTFLLLLFPCLPSKLLVWVMRWMANEEITYFHALINIYSLKNDDIFCYGNINDCWQAGPCRERPLPDAFSSLDHRFSNRVYLPGLNGMQRFCSKSHAQVHSCTFQTGRKLLDLLRINLKDFDFFFGRRGSLSEFSLSR